MIDTQAIRSKILDLAMRGQLTEQLSEDGSAEELYQQIQIEKQARINAGTIKKSKPLSEVTAEEIPFEIPESWKWVRVGSITEIAGGTTPSASEISSSGTIPYYKVSDMNTPGNEKQMIYASNYISEGYTGKIFPAGTTIFPKNGGAALTNKRRVLTVPSAVDLNTGGCTPLLYEMANWIRLFMETVDFGKMDTGSNIPTVNATNLKSQLMTLPPLAEQQRIVERIEKAFSVLDTIDTLQAQYADNLTVLKSKLIDAAIQGKLTEQLPEDGTAKELLQYLRTQKKEIEESGVLKGRKKKNVLTLDDAAFPFSIPPTWEWIRLDSVAEIFGRIGFRGYTKSDIVEQGKGAISLSPSNITIDGKCIYEKCTYITWEKYDESPEIMVNEEDLIIVKTGSSYGKCGVVKALPEKATINPQLALLKYVLCNRYYLHIVLNSTLAHKQYEDFVVGAATPTFSQEDLANFILPLPPLAEQERIVERLNKLFSACEGLKENSI